MRIGYLVPEFPGQTHIMFWREISALREMGESVFLVSTRRPSTKCPHEFAAQAIEETHYIFPPALPKLGRWAAAGFNGFGACMSYVRSLEDRGLRDRAKQMILLAAAVDLATWARGHRIEHIHGHSCADTAHVLVMTSLLGGPSYSVTLHGDLAVYGNDHHAKLKNAKFVSAVGSHLREQLSHQAGIPDHRILETFMGIDTAMSRKSFARSTPGRGKLNLVSVARLIPAKGLEYVFAAIHRGLKDGLDLRYTVVGHGPHLAELVARVDELGIQEHVEFTGQLSEDGVYAALAASDALILASVGFGEAWPVAVMEAMSIGLPVIATRIGATPQMIDSGEDGYLVPQADADAILQAVSLLADDLDLRKKIGEAARATALRRFDVRVSAAALRDAIGVSDPTPNITLASNTLDQRVSAF